MTLIHNPGAGEGGHEQDDLVAALRSAGHEVVFGDGERLEASLEEPGDLVAVAGGDGTVRDVLRPLAGRGVPVGVLPLGSANNIARWLGIEPPEDIAAAIRSWEGAPRRRFDVWEVSWSGHRRRFVESFGGGLMADVIARADAMAEDPGRDEKLEIGLRMLCDVAASGDARAWELVAADGAIAGDLLGFELMNVGETGPAIRLAPGADAGDGALDVVPVPVSAGALLRDYARERLAGGTPELPPFASSRWCEVTVRPPDGALLRLDDEVLDVLEAAELTVSGGGELAVDIVIPEL
ncbi:MAG TPA: diacylglycerol kinase family protein [Gaiellales bacterium]|nr:diacylglycerol kinase family protein [Gaiellales bacterium]